MAADPAHDDAQYLVSVTAVLEPCQQSAGQQSGVREEGAVCKEKVLKRFKLLGDNVTWTCKAVFELNTTLRQGIEWSWVFGWN